MNNLKPCPFCGSQKVGVCNWLANIDTYSEHLVYWVACRSCHACGADDLGESGVI